MIEREAVLDLNGMTSPVHFRVSQFDTVWRFVLTIFYQGDAWQIPPEATAVLNVRKPDGTVCAVRAEVEDNRVCVDCDIQMTTVAGAVVCELSIMSGGKLAGSANFILDVEAAPVSLDDVSSESTLPAYGEILDRIAELEQGVGVAVTVDSALSAVSENPVQNKVIKQALDAKADANEVYCGGKNLLVNGKPMYTIQSGDISGIPQADSGWGFAVADDDTVHEVAGEYFQFTVPYGTSGVRTLQLNKAYKLANSRYQFADNDLLKIIGGRKATISFELKSNVAFELVERLRVMSQDNQTLLSLFSISDKNLGQITSWQRFTATDVFPSDFVDVFTGAEASTSRLYFQFKVDTANLSPDTDGEIYLRNIKLEYGDTATDFTYSDRDVTNILTDVLTVPNASGVSF